MAIHTQPTTLIPQAFGASGNKNTIPNTNSTPSASQAASWASGFPSECSTPINTGGCPVPRADINGVLYALSALLLYFQDGGIPMWGKQIDYDVARVVQGSDHNLYISKAQSGPNVAAGFQNPVNDNTHTYWDLLPINDSGLVHTSGAETVGGTKTFTTAPVVRTSGDTNLILRNNNMAINAVPSNSQFSTVSFRDANDNGIGRVLLFVNSSTDGSTRGMEISISPQTNSTDYKSIWNGVADTNGNVKVSTGVATVAVHPLVSGVTLGENSTAHRWGQIYSSSTTISTSDERAKTLITDIPNEVLDAWGDVHWQQFKMRDAVAEKGDDARLHTGAIAQAIMDAFAAHGLDAADYGLFCFDSWEATPEVRGEDGHIIIPAQEAGELYSLRYEEALCLEAAYQRRRVDRLEERIAAIEAKLADDGK